MKRIAIAATAAVAALCFATTGCETAQRASLPLAEHREPRGVFTLAPSGDQVVWLTIDDGPSVHTDEMLHLLAEFGATATFFVHTDHITDPDIIEWIAEGGHNLGHHMPSDRDWSEDNQRTFYHGFLESHCALARYAGAYAGRYRPPLGQANDDTMLPALMDAGFDPHNAYVMASFLPWDAGGATETAVPWINRTLARRYGNGVGRAAQPGDIVVFHDGPRLARTQNTLHSLSRFLKVSEHRGLTVRALPPTKVNNSICA